jgi:hypothetical protein
MQDGPSGLEQHALAHERGGEGVAPKEHHGYDARQGLEFRVRLEEREEGAQREVADEETNDGAEAEHERRAGVAGGLCGRREGVDEQRAVHGLHCGWVSRE